MMQTIKCQTQRGCIVLMYPLIQSTKKEIYLFTNKEDSYHDTQLT